MTRLLLPLCCLLVGLPSLTGCSRSVFLPYHSTAEIPYYASSSRTTMTLMEVDGSRSPFRKYGVIAAVDDGVRPYLLIAPARQANVRSLHDALVARGVPLTPQAAEKFLRSVDSALQVWDRRHDSSQGTFQCRLPRFLAHA
jgi:hypothetical protein